MKHRKKSVCGQCGAEALKVRRELEYFTYGSGNRAQTLSAIASVYTCEKCGYQFVGPETEAAYHEAVCKYLGVLPPRKVKELRKAQGLSRAEFSRLTRLGTATIGRWERGSLIQNPAYDHYLYLLQWEENVERLAERNWAQRLANFCEAERIAREPEYESMTDEDLFDLLEDQDEAGITSPPEQDNDPRCHRIKQILSERPVLLLAS